MIFQGGVKKYRAETLVFAGRVLEAIVYCEHSFILENVKDMENTLSSFK